MKAIKIVALVVVFLLAASQHIVGLIDMVWWSFTDHSIIYNWDAFKAVHLMLYSIPVAVIWKLCSEKIIDIYEDYIAP